MEEEFLPSCSSLTSLPVPEGGGTGGGGAREVLLLLLALVVAAVVLVEVEVVVVSSVGSSEMSFKVSSSSCRSFSLFFTMTLRLMVLLLLWASRAIYFFLFKSVWTSAAI